MTHGHDDNHYVRKFWLQRCRDGAAVPSYVIVNFKLDEVFDFLPEPSNRDFQFAAREKPHGPPQANP